MKKNVTNKKEKEKMERRKLEGEWKREGRTVGLEFNSINTSKPDSHIIIKTHPIFH